MTVEKVFELAESVGGKIEEIGVLPDGSGFATMSMELPKTHWLYEVDKDGFSLPPPMPLLMGAKDTIMIQIGDKPARIMDRQEFCALIRQAGKYAVRSATMNGKEDDFDPDALVQNLVVGAVGYFTETGLSGDA